MPKPLVIDGTGLIHLERTIEGSEKAEAFLKKIAEQASNGHEQYAAYRLTPESIIRARFHGVDSDRVTNFFEENSNCSLPDVVKALISDWFNAKPAELRVRNGRIALVADDPILYARANNALGISHWLSRDGHTFYLNPRNLEKAVESLLKKSVPVDDSYRLLDSQEIELIEAGRMYELPSLLFSKQLLREHQRKEHTTSIGELAEELWEDFNWFGSDTVVNSPKLEEGVAKFKERIKELYPVYARLLPEPQRRNLDAVYGSGSCEKGRGYRGHYLDALISLFFVAKHDFLAEAKEEGFLDPGCINPKGYLFYRYYAALGGPEIDVALIDSITKALGYTYIDLGEVSRCYVIPSSALINVDKIYICTPPNPLKQSVLAATPDDPEVLEREIHNFEEKVRQRMSGKKRLSHHGKILRVRYGSGSDYEGIRGEFARYAGVTREDSLQVANEKHEKALEFLGIIPG